jgi:hypothetical protein
MMGKKNHSLAHTTRRKPAGLHRVSSRTAGSVHRGKRMSRSSFLFVSGIGTVSRTHQAIERARKIGSPMHPYIRTMFLALAVGSIGLFASMLYYIHIAHATENSLLSDTASRINAEAALASVDGSFTGLIQDLEAQRKDAGGALPIPPREYLRLRAEQTGVNYALLNRIAYCESHWRMVENKKSTASGYFQILDGTEQLTPQYREGLRKTNPYANIDMAIFLYEKYGTIPWMESQDCWSNK